MATEPSAPAQTSDQFPRPKDHPVELPWPPVVPEYPADSPARRDEESQSPFNLEAATASFGLAYVESLRRSQPKFCGDWWLLAFLLRCTSAAQAVDPDGESRDRLRMWNNELGRGRLKDCVVHLASANLEGLCLAHAHLVQAHLEAASLRGACLDYANAGGARLARADFNGASMHKTVLAAAHLEGANFTGARLAFTELRAAYLEGALLRDAHFESTDLSYAHMTGIDLAGVALDEVRLTQARLSGANLARAVLSRVDLTSAVLEKAKLRGASLKHCAMRETDLQSADLRKADVRFSDVSLARIDGTKLIGARGLFGKNRAIARQGQIDEYEAQNAIYRWEWAGHEEWPKIWNRLGRAVLKDHLSWELLRIIGGLRLFGVSYLSVAAIVTYVALAREFNAAAARAREAAGTTADPEGPLARVLMLMLRHLPEAPTPAHLGRQLAATILLAIAATIYAVACPAEVKEANEVRWTRAMGQPMWEYRSANWSRRVWRYACGVCFAVGGGYSLFYLGRRGADAVWYLLTR